MLAHRRLREDGGLGRVEAGGQVGGGDLAGLLGQQGRVLPDGDGVQVGHEDEGVHLVLQPGELHQGAQIVAQVQGAGRLDAGEHAGRARIGNGGVVGHGFSLGTKWAWRAQRREPRRKRGGTDQRKLRHRGAEEPIEAMDAGYRTKVSSGKRAALVRDPGEPHRVSPVGSRTASSRLPG
jgi:hypothetical protein